MRRFLRTISYLKFEQIYYRLRKLVYKPIIIRIASAACEVPRVPLVKPIEKPISLIGSKSWCLLNVKGDLATVGWNGTERPKLWRYNQHYFDDLNAIGSRERSNWHLELINLWIRENNIGYGDGWDPYPTSIRIVNWIKWSISNSYYSDDFVCSLANQARWLFRNLEWHLLGNHLMTNGKALIFAGIFLHHKDSDAFLKIGFQIIENELIEQFNADGAHFELSPMYHALAVEDLLDLVGICNCYWDKLSADQQMVIQNIHSILPASLNWLSNVTHPDGEIAFFNDAAFGVCARLDELIAYFERVYKTTIALSQTDFFLTCSGFFSKRTDDYMLISDFAKVGADYLAGHGHADSLSFELSLFNQRVFVNSGTSTYENNALRRFQRGTSAHNTICINDQDSSEVWASFRIGERANVKINNIQESHQMLRVAASHDGYRRMQKELSHNREFIFCSNYIQIIDELSITSNARAYYYLHPLIRIQVMNSGACKLDLASGEKCLLTFRGADKVTVDEANWYPEFGKAIPSKVLKCDFSKRMSLKISWI